MEQQPDAPQPLLPEMAKALGASAFLELAATLTAWGTLEQSSGSHGLGIVISALGTTVLAATSGMEWRRFHALRDQRQAERQLRNPGSEV